MAKYKLSDDSIFLEAMKQPSAPLPAYLCEVLPQTTGFVRDMDLVTKESNHRKVLLILSNLLASLQAV